MCAVCTEFGTSHPLILITRQTATYSDVAGTSWAFMGADLIIGIIIVGIIVAVV